MSLQRFYSMLVDYYCWFLSRPPWGDCGVWPKTRFKLASDVNCRVWFLGILECCPCNGRSMSGSSEPTVSVRFCGSSRCNCSTLWFGSIKWCKMNKASNNNWIARLYLRTQVPNSFYTYLILLSFSRKFRMPMWLCARKLKNMTRNVWKGSASLLETWISGQVDLPEPGCRVSINCAMGLQAFAVASLSLAFCIAVSQSSLFNSFVLR